MASGRWATFADVFLWRTLGAGLAYARRGVPLNDCASAILYSRRRMVFLENHWLAPINCRVCYRMVADLGITAMGD